MQLPRYLKVPTFFSAFPSMVMLGGGRAVFGASCLNTSVFLMLTVSPNDFAAVAKQSASSCRSTSEWAASAQSSAKRKSRAMAESLWCRTSGGGGWRNRHQCGSGFWLLPQFGRELQRASERRGDWTALAQARNLASLHLTLEMGQRRHHFLWPCKTCHHGRSGWSVQIEVGIQLAEYRPECSSVHSVKCLREIDEEQVEVLVLLDTFFLELPDSKDHIHCAPLLSEATLALRHNIIQYVLGDPVQHDMGQYLACNAEEADPAVVVAGWAITLVLYKWMMLASLRSRGSWPLTQNTWNILVRWVIRVSPLALNTSAGIPSGPGALPVCNCLMAASTSAVLGGASSSGIMGHCWMDSSASLVTSEVRLSRVLKWRVHCFKMSSLSVRSMPSQFRIGAVVHWTGPKMDLSPA